MEALALHLSGALREFADVTLLTNRRGKRALPFFLAYALLASIWLVRTKRIQAVVLGDAMLAPLGWLLRTIVRVPVVATVHGLDVIYPNPVYQAAVRLSIGRLDLLLPNSTATDHAVRARVPRARTAVVPLGVNPLPEADAPRKELRARFGVNGGPLLLTAGRLIERKGVAWFVEHVLPQLRDDSVYVIAGDGQQAEAVRSAAARAGVAERVRLLGRVPDDVLAAAYAAADVFVMPNVPVAGDMEGFGLVALEASASRLPVVASNLEGITEAVRHERNGFLVEPCSPEHFRRAIDGVISLPARDRRTLGTWFRKYTLAKFSWRQTARRYVEIIEGIVERREG
jgi:glycosyltransferase involved in cell wall biosynthesis